MNYWKCPNAYSLRQQKRSLKTLVRLHSSPYARNISTGAEERMMLSKKGVEVPGPLTTINLTIPDRCALRLIL